MQYDDHGPGLGAALRAPGQSDGREHHESPCWSILAGKISCVTAFKQSRSAAQSEGEETKT